MTIVFYTLTGKSVTRPPKG